MRESETRVDQMIDDVVSNLCVKFFPVNFFKHARRRNSGERRRRCHEADQLFNLSPVEADYRRLRLRDKGKGRSRRRKEDVGAIYQFHGDKATF